MKITTLFCCALFFGINFTAFAQKQPDLNELLIRYSKNHMGALSDVFTHEELQILQEHFNKTTTVEKEARSILSRRISSTKGNIPVSVATIDAESLSVTNLGPSSAIDFEGAGGILNIAQNRAIIVDNANNVYIRGIENNNYKPRGTLVNAIPAESLTGIEVLSNGEVYGMSTNGMNSSHLVRIDPMTNEVTQIGGNNGLILPICMGRGPMDEIFVVDIDDDVLYGVDKSTGATTPIGAIGFNANFGQGMSYDESVGKLIMTAFNADIGDSQLREVDILTGMTLNLGTITPGIPDQFGWSGHYDADLLNTSNNDLEEFTVSPNPARNELQLSSPSPIDLVVIYNILGQKLYSEISQSTEITIDVSGFETGVYLIQVTINGQLGSRKFLKQ